jgi:phosphoribosylaminoimidazolecarboxamide formyltransferase/IMP cyclohydrolase
MYRNIHPDLFPKYMEISMWDDQQRQTLFYEKVEWVLEGEQKGLRYGENPDQEAALYRLANGNLCLGEIECIQPGRFLASDAELLQAGKHPGKINITDADSALDILRYLYETPATVIIKHNNPCGVARGETLLDSFERAFAADRLAAFGGVVACNQSVDEETAQALAEQYFEVVVAPGYTEAALETLRSKKNLRVMRIRNMEQLSTYVGARVLDFTSLIDGGVVVQWSYVPHLLSKENLIVPEAERHGESYRMARTPTEREYADMRFGWLVEAGVTSNSVMFVKDGVTVSIGAGEQDRVGAAVIARDKAYRKYADALSWSRHGMPYHLLESESARADIDEDTASAHGGLEGSVMISDAFFPFRDGVDVGLREGVSAVLQPGGSLRDFEVIQACNEYDAAMMFTGQRSFKH